MSVYRYVHEIAFIGNGGMPYGPYALRRGAFRRLADARLACRKADGCGRAYGAFVKRRRVTQEEWDIAQ